MTVPKHWKGVAFAAYDPDPEVLDFTRCEVCVEKHKLSVGWWYDWTSGTSRVCNSAKGGCGATTIPYNSATFVPMSYSGGDISAIVSSRPAGSYYMIYNEPDVVGQANEVPSTAANKYFYVYNKIKYLDSAAKVGGIGLVHIADDGHTDGGPVPPRPAGQDYLVAFLNRLKWKNDNKASQEPYFGSNKDAGFDFYHVHAYYLGGFPVAQRGGAASSDGGSITFERLKKHLDWIHGWVRTNYDTEVPANVPVWITETSRLDGDAGSNASFMALLWTWLRAAGKGFDQNVQRVAWFSTSSNYSGTNLFEADLSSLTDLGEDWLAKEDNEMFTGFKVPKVVYNNAEVATGTHPIDTSAYDGIPSGIKACFVRVSARWTVMDQNRNAYCKPKGQGWPFTVAAQVRAHEANFWGDQTGIVICDDYGDFDFVVDGPESAKNVYLHICGYWE